MFSSIPPLRKIECAIPYGAMIRAYQIHHNTVSDASYRSTGERRAESAHCIFHYTVRGHGEVIHKGKAYRTNPGEGFFNIINEAGSGYGYPTGETEPWEFVVLCFDGGNIRDAVAELRDAKAVCRVGDPEAFARLCRRFVEQGAADLPLTFFPRLVAMIHDAEQPNLAMAQRFRQIAERDILRNPTIFSIAAEMGFSREYLQREYRRLTGRTPLHDLMQMRFEKLCALLLTSASEAEIAAMMNFPSVSGMSVFFRRMSGTTPSRFRKKPFAWL